MHFIALARFRSGPGFGVESRRVWLQVGEFLSQHSDPGSRIGGSFPRLLPGSGESSA